MVKQLSDVYQVAEVDGSALGITTLIRLYAFVNAENFDADNLQPEMFKYDSLSRIETIMNGYFKQPFTIGDPRGLNQADGLWAILGNLIPGSIKPEITPLVANTKLLYDSSGFGTTGEKTISYIKINADGSVDQVIKESVVDLDDSTNRYLFMSVHDSSTEIQDYDDLLNKVAAYYDAGSEEAANELPTGDPKHWNTEKVLDYSGVFSGQISTYHPKLDNWTMTQATSMVAMFLGSNYNHDLNCLERTLPTPSTLGNMTNMDCVFCDNGVFNNGQEQGDSSNPLLWKTNSATSMTLMFGMQGTSPSIFNQRLGDDSETYFNTSNVKNMHGMFRLCVDFNQSISHFKTGNVDDSVNGNYTGMKEMFFGATSFNNGDDTCIGNLDVSKVGSFASMFFSAVNFDKQINSWNVKENADLTDMIQGSGLSLSDTLNQGFKDVATPGVELFGKPSNCVTKVGPKSGDLTFTFEVPQDISLTLQLPFTVGYGTLDLDYTITWNETKTSYGPFSYTVPAASTTQTVTAKLQLHAGAITAFDTSKWLGIEFLTSVTVGNASTPFVYYAYNENFVNAPVVVTATYVDPFWGLNAKFHNMDDDGGMVHDPSFGVKTLDSLFENAVKLQKVPEVFLVSGVTMDNMFKNATVFNDPVVKNWNLFYIIPYNDSRFEKLQEAIWRVENYIQSAVSAFEGAVAFDQPILQILRNQEKTFDPVMTNISKNSRLSAVDFYRQGFLGVDTLDPIFLNIYFDDDSFLRLTDYKTVYQDENDVPYNYNFSLNRNNAFYRTPEGSYLYSRPFTLDQLVTYSNSKAIKKMDLTFPDGTTSPFANQTEQQARENVSRIFNYTNMFDSDKEYFMWSAVQEENVKIPIRLIYHENGYFNNPNASDKKVSFIEITKIEVRDTENGADIDLNAPETLTIVADESTENDYKISIDQYGNPFVDSLMDYDVRFNFNNWRDSNNGWMSPGYAYSYFLRFKSSTDADYSDLAHWIILDLTHEEHTKATMLPFPVSDAKNYNVDNGQNQSWEVFGTSEDDYLGKLLIADDIESMPDYNSNIGKDILRIGLMIDGDYTDILTSKREVIDSKKSTMRALQKAYTTHVRGTTVTGKLGSVGLGNVYDSTIEDAHTTYNFFRGFFSGNRGITQALGSSTTKTRFLYWQEGLDSVDPTTDAYISFLELGSDGLWRQFKNVLVDDTLDPAIYLYADLINRYAMIKDKDDLKTKIDAWYTERDSNGVDAANALIAGNPKHFMTTNVTDLTGIFYNKIGETHPDIRYWDVGSVTNLYYMFEGSTFNNYIGTWERTLPTEVNKKSSTLKNVTNMSWVFAKNEEFNQPIGNWNTASATTMYLMFAEASKFNQPIGNWNTSSVTDMSFMFRGASEFNQDINTKLITVNGVEYTAWDTKLVTTMESMFERAKNFNYDIQNWNTTNVATIKKMFKEASSFNKSLSTNYKTDNFEFPENKTIKFKLRLEDTYGDDWNNNKLQNMTNDPGLSAYEEIDKGVTIKDQDGKIVTMTEVNYFDNNTGGGSIEMDNIKIFATDTKTDVVDPATEENDYEGTYIANTFREFTVDFTLGTNMKYFISSGDEMFNEMKISMTSLDENYPVNILLEGVYAENKDNQILLDDDVIKKRMNAKNDTWNTMNIVNMQEAFCQAESFNGNVSNWDTSSVKTMNRMFSGFDSMNIDKVRGTFSVTEGFSSRVQNNNYMVTSVGKYSFENNTGQPGGNVFSLAYSTFSTWPYDKLQFPFKFTEGGKITFSAQVQAPKDVVMYFGFNEDQLGTDMIPTYETNKVTITPTVNKYEIIIPSNATEYYNAFILLDTYDVMVKITDVIIEYDNKKEEDYTKPMSFDQNIGEWKVGQVLDFTQMFKNNVVFDNGGSNLIDLWRFGLSNSFQF